MRALARDGDKAHVSKACAGEERRQSTRGAHRCSLGHCRPARDVAGHLRIVQVSANVVPRKVSSVHVRCVHRHLARAGEARRQSTRSAHICSLGHCRPAGDIAGHLRIGQGSANVVPRKVSSVHVRCVRRHLARAGEARRQSTRSAHMCSLGHCRPAGDVASHLRMAQVSANAMQGRSAPCT